MIEQFCRWHGTKARPTARAAVVGIGLLTLASILPLPAVARDPDSIKPLMSEAVVPLVLKDGRLAQISVYAVPFKAGTDGLSETTAADLSRFARELATDCFLTAQAIGHVSPGTPGDGEALAAHRIARSRAEQIQQLLAANGLPLASIASVWDWQLMVPESRVTLWVFRLNKGDDCEGKPIDVGQAAAGPMPQAPGRPATGSADTITADATALTNVQAPADKVLADDKPTERIMAAPAEAAPVVEDAPTLLSAMASEAAAETLPASAAMAEATSERRVAGGDARAAVLTPAAGPPPRETAALPPETEEPASTDETLVSTEITFDPNSSFLPRGISGELKRLIKTLPPGKGYEVEVLATVSDTDVKDAGPKQAARYNRWLAERRLGRVSDWLEQNIEVRDLAVKRGFIEHDSSRRVLIRIRSLLGPSERT